MKNCFKNFMKTAPLSPANSLLGLLFAVILFSLSWNLGFAEATNPIQEFNSPIVKLEPEKGFFLITTEAGILWIQVQDPVKEHLKTLEVGDVINVIVEVRPDSAPPILKSWKLDRSGSPCKIFDGKACSKG